VLIMGEQSASWREHLDHPTSRAVAGTADVAHRSQAVSVRACGSLPRGGESRTAHGRCREWGAAWAWKAGDDGGAAQLHHGVRGRSWRGGRRAVAARRCIRSSRARRGAPPAAEASLSRTRPGCSRFADSRGWARTLTLPHPPRLARRSPLFLQPIPAEPPAPLVPTPAPPTRPS
jgi:hypothetical protein